MGSSLLGQQQLLDPPPVRRLVVPQGCGAWYGVDPSTARVAIAYVASDGSRGVSTASFARLEGGARLAAIWRETAFLCRGLLEEWPAPGVVLVEQPSGRQPNPPLSYATGVIMGAVAAVTGARVETCSSGWWKARACGKGNIYKPKRGEGEYGVLTWARANGYAGSSWDEADALGIAEAARREIGLEQR